MSHEDSGGEHLCSKEVSRGLLKPSLEETLSFNRSRSVREEEEAEVVGSCQVQFLMFSFCPFFVFHYFYTFISFYFAFVTG